MTVELYQAAEPKIADRFVHTIRVPAQPSRHNVEKIDGEPALSGSRGILIRDSTYRKLRWRTARSGLLRS